MKNMANVENGDNTELEILRNVIKSRICSKSEFTLLDQVYFKIITKTHYIPYYRDYPAHQTESRHVKKHLLTVPIFNVNRPDASLSANLSSNFWSQYFYP